MLAPFLLAVSLICVSCYRPVVLVHGMFGSAPSEFGKTFENWIKSEHNGTIIYAIRMFEKLCSLRPMWYQVGKINEQVREIMRGHPEGVHFVCYSQGGLLCRGIVSSMNHNVHNFISLSSPQAGQYGIPRKWDRYMPANCIKTNIYKFFYTHFVQNHLSVANYWNDPHQQTLYRNYSVFLSHLDGSTPSPNMSDYKRNFLKLHRLVLIGGPDDDVVTPWQSSQFSFYDENENVVEMKKQKFFQDDSFGLQTLYNKKRVHIHTFPGVVHKKWYANRTVFNSAILPYLT